EARAVADAMSRDLVESHLAHQLWTEPLEREVLLAVPPAGHGDAGGRLLRSPFSVGFQGLHELPTGLLGEARGEPHLPQLAVRSVQPEEEGAHRRLELVLRPSAPDDDAVGRSLSL